MKVDNEGFGLRVGNFETRFLPSIIEADQHTTSCAIEISWDISPVQVKCPGITFCSKELYYI